MTSDNTEPVSSHGTPGARARAALAEWCAVAVVLVGCAAVTAGVMTLAMEARLGIWISAGGAAVIFVGAAAWTTIVKRRNPSPRAARREL